MSGVYHYKWYPCVGGMMAAAFSTATDQAISALNGRPPAHPSLACYDHNDYFCIDITGDVEDPDADHDVFITGDCKYSSGIPWTSLVNSPGAVRPFGPGKILSGLDRHTPGGLILDALAAYVVGPWEDLICHLTGAIVVLRQMNGYPIPNTPIYHVGVFSAFFTGVGTYVLQPSKFLVNSLMPDETWDDLDDSDGLFDPVVAPQISVSSGPGISASLDLLAKRSTSISLNNGQVIYSVESGDITEP
jgi:hypothetical protein